MSFYFKRNTYTHVQNHKEDEYLDMFLFFDFPFIKMSFL